VKALNSSPSTAEKKNNSSTQEAEAEESHMLTTFHTYMGMRAHPHAQASIKLPPPTPIFPYLAPKTPSGKIPDS
jgi:hypothetical protein